MSRKRFVLGCLWVQVGVMILVGGIATCQEITLSYNISVHLDAEQHILLGSEQISVVNSSDRSLKELYFHLHPNRFMDEGSIYAKEIGLSTFDRVFSQKGDSGYILIEEINVDGVPHEGTIDDTILLIDLQKPVSVGEEVKIDLVFRTKIPQDTPRFGHSRGNYYISWWYPWLAAYDAEGWHPYQSYGKDPDETYSNFATYRVDITLPQEMVVGATGILEEEIGHPDGTKTMTFFAENVHDFTWVADFRYAVETLFWEDVTIRSLYFPEHEKTGKRVAQYARDAIAYFSEAYGRYPYANFTVAEVGMRGGAMEYPQLAMLCYTSYSMPSFMSALRQMTVHETGHQWFFGMLMNDQVNETWLDEGFTTFIAEAEYLGSKGGYYDVEALDNLPLIGPLLKNVLSTEAQPSLRDVLSLGYWMLRLENEEVPLLIRREDIRPGQARSDYERGAFTLLALQAVVGEETFFKIMRSYVERYRFQRVTTQDFIQVAEEVSGQDLGWFFDQWLLTTKQIDFVLEDVIVHRVDEAYVIRVALRQDGEMRMPVDVEVTLENGEVLNKHWEGRERCGVLTFYAAAYPQSVVVDPKEVFPDLHPENNLFPRPVTMPSLLPLMERGADYGYGEDGFILGIQFQRLTTESSLPSSVPSFSGKLAYCLGSERLVYGLGIGSSPRVETGKRLKMGAGMTWSVGFDDDGHSILGNLSGGYYAATWPSDQLKSFFSISVQPFFGYLYDRNRDVGTLAGLSLESEIELDNLAGWSASFDLCYKGGLPRLRSDFSFTRYSLDAALRQRVDWRTTLNIGLAFGKLAGSAPNGGERFDIQDDGHFCAFEREDSQFAALNLAFLVPVPEWVKQSLGTLVFDVTSGFFVNLGWFGDRLETLRTEIGWRLNLDVQGLEDLIALKYVAWTNTGEDGGKPGLHVVFNYSF